MNNWSKIFPFLHWWPLVNKESLQADFSAGLTGAVIQVTQSVAFALIAGLPPEYGLYTGMIVPIIAALFGSSWHLVSGPTTAMSIVVFASVSEFATPGEEYYVSLAITLTFMVGVIQFIMGLARLGTLVNFVSQSVVVGFTAGAAVLIFTKQLKYIFSLELTPGSNFMDTWEGLFWQIGKSDEYVLSISIVTLVVAIAIKKWSKKIPYMLFAIIAGSLLANYYGAAEKGIPLIGEVPASLPPLSMPSFHWGTVQELMPKAFALALLGLITAVSFSRAIASQSGQRINGNVEFTGQGISNIVGSFFSCYASSGSLTRSGLNYESGAKTPMASIFTAILLTIIVLFFARFASYIPMASMGAIILMVAWSLVDFQQIYEISRTSKSELGVLLVTFLSTLFLDLEFAIYVGVLMSLAVYLQKLAQPAIIDLAPSNLTARRWVNVKYVEAEECPQFKIIRVDGSLFFGSVSHIADRFEELAEQGNKNLLLVANGVNRIDMAGAELLAREAQRIKSTGGMFLISGLKKSSLRYVERGGYLEEIGEENIFTNKTQAIEYFYKKRDESICTTCSVKVFWECKKEDQVLY